MAVRIWLTDGSRLTLEEFRVVDGIVHGRVVEHADAPEPFAVGSIAAVPVESVREGYQTQQPSAWPAFAQLGLGAAAAIVILYESVFDLGNLFP